MRTTLLAAAALCVLAAAPARAQTPFAVQVTLSPAAGARLRALNEGIVVDAMVSGPPLPAARRQADERGMLAVGEEKVTLPAQGGTATFTNSGLSPAKLALLRSRDLHLLVNVFSARLSGPDNLLNCDIFDDSLAKAAAQPMRLRCKLITEGF